MPLVVKKQKYPVIANSYTAFCLLQNMDTTRIYGDITSPVVISPYCGYFTILLLAE